MTVSTVASVQDMCHDLLAACAAVLAPTAGGAPVRQFVSYGPPAYDCDQLTVHVAAMGEETTSPLSPIPQTGHRTLFGRVNLITLVATVTRCVNLEETLQPETTSIITADANVIHQDAWAIWSGIYGMIYRGELFSLCNEIHFDSGSIVAAEGGIVGWAFTLRVGLSGIPV